jgi:hypothetical protein
LAHAILKTNRSLGFISLPRHQSRLAFCIFLSSLKHSTMRT